jgi:hypothetical protein
LPWVGGELEGFEGESEVTDERVVKSLDARAVELDVVGRLNRGATLHLFMCAGGRDRVFTAPS